jgi:hypothetical protein
MVYHGYSVTVEATVARSNPSVCDIYAGYGLLRITITVCGAHHQYDGRTSAVFLERRVSHILLLSLESLYQGVTTLGPSCLSSPLFSILFQLLK